MYARAMFNTAYRITGDYHYAEDIMHEAFIKAFDHIDSYRGDASFGAWLKRIVINESLQWLRKYQVWDHDTETLAEPSTGEDDNEIFDRPHREEIARALMQLRPNYRSILSLHYIEGYDLQEIAQIMGISYQNVRTMLSRARKKLKSLLQDEYGKTSS